MTDLKYLEFQKTLKTKTGIDLDKSTAIKNALEKFEKRVWEEAEDYYLPYSPLEKLARKMERINKIMEESEKTGNA